MISYFIYIQQVQAIKIHRCVFLNAEMLLSTVTGSAMFCKYRAFLLSRDSRVSLELRRECLPAKISDIAVQYQLVVTASLSNSFMVLFRLWQHLVKVRERSWCWFNTKNVCSYLKHETQTHTVCQCPTSTLTS